MNFVNERIPAGEKQILTNQYTAFKAEQTGFISRSGIRSFYDRSTVSPLISGRRLFVPLRENLCKFNNDGPVSGIKISENFKKFPVVSGESLCTIYFFPGYKVFNRYTKCLGNSNCNICRRH